MTQYDSTRIVGKWSRLVAFLLCLLYHIDSKVCPDFFGGICIRVSLTENSVEKQGISKRDVMGVVYSGLICRKDKIFL